MGDAKLQLKWLVMTNIAMENHHLNRYIIYFYGSFSIAMLVITRGFLWLVTGMVDGLLWQPGFTTTKPLLEAIGIHSGFDFVVPPPPRLLVKSRGDFGGKQCRDHKLFRNGTRVRTNLPTQSAQVGRRADTHLLSIAPQIH